MDGSSSKSGTMTKIGAEERQGTPRDKHPQSPLSLSPSREITVIPLLAPPFAFLSDVITPSRQTTCYMVDYESRVRAAEVGGRAEKKKQKPEEQWNKINVVLMGWGEPETLNPVKSWYLSFRHDIERQE